MSKRTGKVKWFDPQKGYGFILPDDGGADLFVHFSAIQVEGYKTLNQDDEVEYDVVVGDKGKDQAADVAVTKAAPKKSRRDEGDE